MEPAGANRGNERTTQISVFTPYKTRAQFEDGKEWNATKSFAAEINQDHLNYLNPNLKENLALGHWMTQFLETIKERIGKQDLYFVPAEDLERVTRVRYRELTIYLEFWIGIIIMILLINYIGSKTNSIWFKAFRIVAAIIWFFLIIKFGINQGPDRTSLETQETNRTKAF